MKSINKTLFLKSRERVGKHTSVGVGGYFTRRASQLKLSLREERGWGEGRCGKGTGRAGAKALGEAGRVRVPARRPAALAVVSTVTRSELHSRRMAQAAVLRIDCGRGRGAGPRVKAGRPVRAVAVVQVRDAGGCWARSGSHKGDERWPASGFQKSN